MNKNEFEQQLYICSIEEKMEIAGMANRLNEIESNRHREMLLAADEFRKVEKKHAENSIALRRVMRSTLPGTPEREAAQLQVEA